MGTFFAPIDALCGEVVPKTYAALMHHDMKNARQWILSKSPLAGVEF
jgi:hypothetical protein